MASVAGIYGQSSGGSYFWRGKVPVYGAIKSKKPIYKKWWFWLILVVIVGMIGAPAGVNGSNQGTDGSDSSASGDGRSGFHLAGHALYRTGYRGLRSLHDSAVYQKSSRPGKEKRSSEGGAGAVLVCAVSGYKKPAAFLAAGVFCRQAVYFT